MRRKAMRRAIIALAVALVCAGPVQAGLVATQLTNTSQINPESYVVYGAANTIFAGQGTGGTVHGVNFQDAIWGTSTSLSGGVTFLATTAGAWRDPNTASTISGTDEAVLERIANGINYYSYNVTGTLTFGNLPANHSVEVQLITSDAASSFNNWAGRFDVSLIDTVTLATTFLGNFQAGTEPNNLDAQLATFAGVTDSAGKLQILIKQTVAGQNAGIGGVAVYGTPEPSALVLVASGLLALGLLGWRSRAR